MLFPLELWDIISQYLYADIDPCGDSIIVVMRPCTCYTVALDPDGITRIYPGCRTT
jgi:hypothetical protein